MDTKNLLIFLVIGSVSGCLAGRIMKSGGLGLLANTIIGMIGGAAGGLLFRLLEIKDGSLIGMMASAAVGAVMLLYAVRLFKNGKKSSIQYKGDELWVRRKPLNRR